MGSSYTLSLNPVNNNWRDMARKIKEKRTAEITKAACERPPQAETDHFTPLYCLGFVVPVLDSRCFD